MGEDIEHNPEEEMKIAVDFDGTIVEHRFPKIGKPRPMAFEVLKALGRDGHKIILWSNREGKRLEEAVKFCKDNGVEFYAVNSEYPDSGWTGSGVSRKIVADVYIDDKNLGGLPSWDEIYQKICRKTYTHKHHGHHHRKTGKWYDGIVLFFDGIADKCRNARSGFRL